MNELEDILAENAKFGNELDSLVTPGGGEDPLSEEAEAEIEAILSELADREDITDEEFDMLRQTAEELGAEFIPWIEDYLGQSSKEIAPEMMLEEDVPEETLLPEEDY